MNDNIICYSGKIRIQVPNGYAYSDYANMSIDVSPEYTTIKNIFKNDINTLDGFRVSANIDLYFFKNSQNYSINNIGSMVRTLSSCQTDINSLGDIDPFVVEVISDFDEIVKTFGFDKISSSINMTDYISNNMNIGNKISLKLERGKLYSSIPLWILDSAYTNVVDANVDFIYA